MKRKHREGEVSLPGRMAGDTAAVSTRSHNQRNTRKYEPRGVFPVRRALMVEREEATAAACTAAVMLAGSTALPAVYLRSHQPLDNFIMGNKQPESRPSLVKYAVSAVEATLQ